MRTIKPRSPARVARLRALFATVTLTLVVLACAGIQAVANWTAAPHQTAAAVQALDPAHAAVPAQQPGGIPLGLTVVGLVLLIVVRLVFRARSVGSRLLYGDEVPW